MGLFDTVGNAFGGKGVSYTPVDIDPKTQKLIDDSVTRATASNEEIAGKLNQGVNDTGNQALQTDQSLKQEAAQTGQDPSMLQAIRNQFNQSAGKGIQRIISNNNNQAQLTKANWLQQSAQYSMAQQNVATQNFAALTQAYSDSQMARAQLISSVLSLGGTAGGMMMGRSQSQGNMHRNGSSGEMPRQQTAFQLPAMNDMAYGNYA